ncbi:hypothetical protein [Anaerovibrio sp. JC8]|uniref:hypothetical protein n=1 Tax=Anaerovibrio sp. JC8 TaxID=1240085 RepID=UPI001301E827|nr:hypothetical protein [Anaerovibrio sp. JC8]
MGQGFYSSPPSGSRWRAPKEGASSPGRFIQGGDHRLKSALPFKWLPTPAEGHHLQGMEPTALSTATLLELDGTFFRGYDCAPGCSDTLRGLTLEKGRRLLAAAAYWPCSRR